MLKMISLDNCATS